MRLCSNGSASKLSDQHSICLQGRWYITAGLNPLFDDFDCQEHYFGVPEPGKLYGKINWRIAKPDKDFIERSTVQTFKQVWLNT